MSEHARRGESFLSSLQAKTNDLANKVSTRQGDWIIKGFVDVMRNLYTLSNDTKVISKVMEILILPELAYFTEENNYKLARSTPNKQLTSFLITLIANFLCAFNGCVQQLNKRLSSTHHLLFEIVIE